MGQQVRLHPELTTQLDRRSIRDGELVDDGQTRRIAQRGMAPGPLVQTYGPIHAPQSVTLRYMSQ